MLLNWMQTEDYYKTHSGNGPNWKEGGELMKEYLKMTDSLGIERKNTLIVKFNEICKANLIRGILEESKAEKEKAEKAEKPKDGPIDGPTDTKKVEDEVVVWDKGDEQTLRMLERFEAGGSTINALLLTHLREKKDNAKQGFHSDVNEEFYVIYIGSRSNEKHHLSVYADMTIGHFKHILYAEFHGMEFDYEGKEADYTNKHNIQMAKSGKVLMDSLTFADYGIKKSNVPFELTLKFTLDAGGKRVSLTD